MQEETTYVALRAYGADYGADHPEYDLADAIYVAQIKANADREKYTVRPYDGIYVGPARYTINPKEGL